MYWRVRNLGPEHLIRQYGVHAILGVSIFFNLILFTTRPAGPKGVDKAFRRSTEQLAKDVTTQMLDSSYINYQMNAMTLLNRNGGELDPPLIRKLQQQQNLPKDEIELKATLRTLQEEKNVVAVRVDQVVTGDPTQQGLIPVDVAGVVAMHSASGAEPPKNFHFRYIMGMRKTGEKEQNPDANTHSRYASGPPGAQMQEVQVPVVADIQDLSGQPMPAGPTGGP